MNSGTPPVARYAAAITARTRLILVSQMVFVNGNVLPVREVVALGVDAADLVVDDDVSPVCGDRQPPDVRLASDKTGGNGTGVQSSAAPVVAKDPLCGAGGHPPGQADAELGPQGSGQVQRLRGG